MADRGLQSRDYIDGSHRRVIEAVVERVLAGESAKRVAEDYPDEYGYGPVLDNLERAIRSRDQRINHLEQTIGFEAGYETAAESRDQRIKRMVPVVRAASEVYEIMGDEGDFAGLRDLLAALEPGDFDAS